MELNDQKILLTNQVSLRQSKILHIIILSHYIKMLYFKQHFLLKNICQEKFDQSNCEIFYHKKFTKKGVWDSSLMLVHRPLSGWSDLAQIKI